MNSTSFTFLATILILVLLSVSLVLRSYVLRRRYRQRFHHALTEGIFPDLDRPLFTGPDQLDPSAFRRRRLGPSPVLWDTWIHPPDEDDALSSITPIAVRCHPSSDESSPTKPPAPPTPLPPQPRRSFFSQLRIQGPFARSPRPPSPLAQSPAGYGNPPTSPDPSTSEKNAATLQVYVLVAMPAETAPVHHLPPDAKGKGIDQHEFQVHQTSGDADPLLPSALRIPGSSLDRERLPLLEFGVVEIGTGDWVWKSSTS